MARLTKSGARSEIASGGPQFAAIFNPNGTNPRDAHEVKVSLDAASGHRYTLSLSRTEAIALAAYIARVCNRKFVDHIDIRRKPVALRDLADYLDTIAAPDAAQERAIDAG